MGIFKSKEGSTDLDMNMNMNMDMDMKTQIQKNMTATKNLIFTSFTKGEFQHILDLIKATGYDINTKYTSSKPIFRYINLTEPEKYQFLKAICQSFGITILNKTTIKKHQRDYGPPFTFSQNQILLPFGNVSGCTLSHFLGQHIFYFDKLSSISISDTVTEINKSFENLIDWCNFYKIDWFKQDSEGSTIWHIIAMTRNVTMAKYLKYDSRILTIKNKKGETPVQIAKKYNMTEMIEFMEGKN